MGLNGWAMEVLWMSCNGGYKGQGKDVLADPHSLNVPAASLLHVCCHWYWKQQSHVHTALETGFITSAAS